jgi:hypothetical protein
VAQAIDVIEGFLVGGGAAALILLVVLIEGALLTLRQRRGVGPPVLRWLSPLAAGAALVGALWAQQAGFSSPVIGSLLILAGIAHLLGARERWGS